METALELLFVAVPLLFGALLRVITGHFGVLQRVAPALATVVLAGGVFAYASILMGSSFGLAGLMAIGSSVLAVVIFNALYGVGFASQRPPDAK